MGLEIERKFIVSDLQWLPTDTPRSYIRQGYLSTEPSRTVRVRIIDSMAKITIKGANINGARAEYEYDIPVPEAREMLDNLCLSPQIEKYRYFLPVGPHQWEIDHFLGENAGLIIAEVELQAIDEEIHLPPWLGKEVTIDHKYSNSFLSLHPYSTWDVT